MLQKYQTYTLLTLPEVLQLPRCANRYDPLHCKHQSMENVTGTSSMSPYRGWLVRTPSATWSAPTLGLTPASAGPRWTQLPGSELIYSSFNKQQLFLTTTLWIHFPMYMLSNICREAGQLWGRGRLRLQQTRDSQEADFFIRFCQFSECLPAETRNLTESFDLTGITMETESGP